MLYIIISIIAGIGVLWLLHRGIKSLITERIKEEAAKKLYQRTVFNKAMQEYRNSTGKKL